MDSEIDEGLKEKIIFYKPFCGGEWAVRCGQTFIFYTGYRIGVCFVFGPPSTSTTTRLENKPDLLRYPPCSAVLSGVQRNMPFLEFISHLFAASFDFNKLSPLVSTFSFKIYIFLASRRLTRSIFMPWRRGQSCALVGCPRIRAAIRAACPWPCSRRGR